MGVVATQTACGPLNRRFLMQMQGRTGVAASSSALIVLHDEGESAGQAPLTTRWWFGGLAQRERILLVYAHGGPRANDNPVPYDRSSVWQTDDDAHPAVNDFEYLRAIVDDLRVQREGPPDVPPQLLASNADVFLAGYGSGAMMALAAAARHPERYSGVAAFLPNRSLRPGELDLGAAARRAAGEHRLRSVLVALRAASDGANEDAVAIAAEWAAALGIDASSARASRHDPGIVRIDSNLTGAVALRVLRLSAEVDPFPLPGGIGEARAASQARPFFFDGPDAAWEFFQQRN
jgi:poly(3-hydroxybutyrate) depolymerase